MLIAIVIKPATHAVAGVNGLEFGIEYGANLQLVDHTGPATGSKFAAWRQVYQVRDIAGDRIQHIL
jgi:hypothetical protein